MARDCRTRVAASTDEELQLSAGGEECLREALGKEQIIHLLYCTFRKGQPLEPLREFRRRSRDAMLMLIADPKVSPLEYLRPGVAPDGLMLRPLDRKKLEEANREFMDSFFERFHVGSASDSFVVDTREEKVYVPYASIYYFEARDKKLFVRTRDGEYPFYGTIEALEASLPENFARCHRSYVVNRDKVKRMLTVENYLDLGSGIGVPVSRSYRSAFRGGKT